jgi:hypothetical protein
MRYLHNAFKGIVALLLVLGSWHAYFYILPTAISGTNTFNMVLGLVLVTLWTVVLYVAGHYTYNRITHPTKENV